MCRYRPGRSNSVEAIMTSIGMIASAEFPGHCGSESHGVDVTRERRTPAQDQRLQLGFPQTADQPIEPAEQHRCRVSPWSRSATVSYRGRCGGRWHPHGGAGFWQWSGRRRDGPSVRRHRTSPPATLSPCRSPFASSPHPNGGCGGMSPCSHWLTRPTPSADARRIERSTRGVLARGGRVDRRARALQPLDCRQRR
jgi:hypothetical protein